MFEVSIDYSFSAGHALRNYKGKCENVHGHNYKVRVAVEGDELDSTGLLVDFIDLSHAVKAIVGRFDHQLLNDVAPFDQLNPSAENMARYFCQELEPRINRGSARVQAVTVWETDTSFACYRPQIGA
ncbi:MAG TPA: 6-carboxytetrahydropterin synthase QueD [Terriglobia bacterium]|nr:6-carboxytetrahydropterin synthase QueD [Terriglobia bacterium]